jgi:hypothetical protein
MIWPTIKRLRFLERERGTVLRQVASLMDENEDLKRILSASLRAERALMAKVSRLESEREIEGLLKEAAE